MMSSRRSSRSEKLLRSFSSSSGSTLSERDKDTELEDSLAKSKFPKWPVDTSKSECHRRNKFLESYIKGHDWYVSSEFHLLRRLIMIPASLKGWKRYYDRYPLIFDLEWECCVGRGDLVCTDGKNRFLIVELKSLRTDGDGTKRTRKTKKRQKLRHGEEQVNKFANFWHDENPQVEQTTGIFITEEGVESVIKLKR